jgi:hypothetical protein
VSQRLLPSLGLLCLVPAAALAGGFDLRETQDAVVVATSAYELSLSRTGAAATLTRGGATVLDGWAASGPGGVFEKGGTSQTIGTLANVSREGDQVTLDYATSVRDSLARLELRPTADAVRVTVRRRPRSCGRPSSSAASRRRRRSGTRRRG